MHQFGRKSTLLGSVLLVLALSPVALGCAEDLKFQPSVEPENAAAIVTDDNGNGSFTTRVRAEEADVWTYFDFQSGAEILPADVGAQVWDLAFRRFHIQSNGGVSAGGGVRIALLASTEFDSLTQAPESGYLEDRADGEDDGAEPDTVFEAGDGWYAYDPSTHTLSPRPVVYAIQSAEGDFFKLQMLGYYDQSGSDARPSFRWAPLLAPGSAPEP